jgi:4-hydroxybenzoate polyprenyltransferase
MLLFPPFLGGIIFQVQLTSIIIPFISFCLASSATYIVNDAADYKVDREHPKKQFRPLSAGDVTLCHALWIAGILLVTALFFAASVSTTFLTLLTTYLIISALYSFYLKNYPLVDLFCIASGFILRLLAGGEAYGITVSEWLFLTVFLLALFLSTGKRYSEKKSLGAHAGGHRRVLSAYPDGFLDGLLFMSGSSVLVTYTMYVISRHSILMIYSVPLSCYGLLCYILRVQSGKGGDPTESLTRDPQLLLVGLTWSVLVGWGVYGR